MLLLSAVAVSASGAIAAADETFPGHLITDPAQLQAIYSGNTLSGTMADLPDTIWSEFYCPNGVAIYTVLGQIRKGFWRVTEDANICFAFDPPGYQYWRCKAAYLQEDGGLIIHADQSMDHYAQTSFINPPQNGDTLRLQSRTSSGCDADPIS